MGIRHGSLGEAENHQIHDAEYATRAAREAATYVAEDIGKVVRQTDEDSYYLVKSITPTFLRIDRGESILTSTTDDTTTELWSYTMGDNSAIYIEAIVTGMETDGSNRNVYKIAGAFYRDGGNVTQQGSTATIFSEESDATWGAVEFNISTNDIEVQATGKAATNISWNSRVTIDYTI